MAPTNGTIALHETQWIIPTGFVIGVVVVVAFEYLTEGLLTKHRKLRFKTLTKHAEGVPLDPVIERKLMEWVNGPRNVFSFWTGAFLLDKEHSKEHYTKTYEILAIVCALMLSVTVSFYTAGGTHAHMHGVVCCIANCALWSCTLMSAFFMVAFEGCQTDEHVELLVGLYGHKLMRAPMVLFTIGTFLVFLEFILYFKFTIDATLSCSLCLGGCGIFLPLFLHGMHRMGWAVAIVNKETEIMSTEKADPTLEDMKESFRNYKASKGDKLVMLDLEEFLDFSKHGWASVTSVQRAILTRIFDTYVEAELEKLGFLDDAETTTMTSIMQSPSNEKPLKGSEAAQRLMAKQVLPGENFTAFA